MWVQVFRTNFCISDLAAADQSVPRFSSPDFLGPLDLLSESSFAPCVSFLLLGRYSFLASLRFPSLLVFSLLICLLLCFLLHSPFQGLSLLF